MRDVKLYQSPLILVGALLAGAALLFWFVTRPPAGEEPSRVFFVEPRDGATVSSPVGVLMGADNFTVEPAGEVRAGAGHLHIMVDVPCVEPGEVIPAGEQHLHYGGGQTVAELALEPGTHTLCLQAGDGVHTALPLTDTITITVN